MSHAGNIAKRVKGRAKAMAKPSIPILGANRLPVVPNSTNRKPMIGPVHEKLTRLRVNAIRKILRRPVVVSDFLSTAMVKRLGRVISNPPKKLAPNTSNIRKKKILNIALVLRAFKALAPKHKVTSNPKATYITTIHTP